MTSSHMMAGKRSRADLPPVWSSLLAVIAHPDDASTGLGAILDAFIFADTRVEVLCLTHGQTWRLSAAPGDLAAMRGAEVASVADVVGASRASLEDAPDGALAEVGQNALAAEVVATAEVCHPDGLLVFNTGAIDNTGAVNLEAGAEAGAGYLDHATATLAGLQAAEILGLPVLGWTLHGSVAARLKHQLGVSPAGPGSQDIDLRVTLDRARQRVASRVHESRALPGSDQWRQLQLLADTGSLVWL